MLILLNIIFIAFYLLVTLRHYNVLANSNQTVHQLSLVRIEEDSTFHVPGDKWTTEVIKDIAFYLRNHKFYEWDRRYYEKKPTEHVGFFDTFPTPKLRSLHWEVKANCDNDFYKCISYLHSIVNTAPYTRSVDLSIINANNNETQIKKIFNECEERYVYAEKTGLPFNSPTEKFQWSVSASYYMCWYTMLGEPALSMIGEACNNFANCFDTYYGSHNRDPRANDNLSFKCAMYSFCPNPCCPIKHVESMAACYNDERNPCFVENSQGDTSRRVCHMDRKYNQSFKDIINNRWNISCNCMKGFIWVSKFGMCVDINECVLGVHDCDVISQDCLNVPGTFICICKWEFDFNANATLCLRRNITLYSV